MGITRGEGLLGEVWGVKARPMVAAAMDPQGTVKVLLEQAEGAAVPTAGAAVKAPLWGGGAAIAAGVMVAAGPAAAGPAAILPAPGTVSTFQVPPPAPLHPLPLGNMLKKRGFLERG